MSNLEQKHSFEDRAQKNYKLHALHNSYINIDNDQTEVVGHDETIGNDRTESVGNDETISIGNDQDITVNHDQNNHILNTQANKIDKDKITYVGNHRVDETYANQTLKVGGHYDVTVNGKLDTKAGTHIKEVTKLKEMHGSDRIVFKSAGGTIIIDGGGITLKGNVTIKGNVAISGGSGGGAKSANLRVNKGKPFCMSCFLKSMGMEV